MLYFTFYVIVILFKDKIMEVLNSIINGDCIEEMKKLPSNSIDLIFVDPPYWMRVDGVLTRVEGTTYNGCDDNWDKFNSLEEYEKFTEAWLKGCYRVLKPNGSIWVIGGMQCIYTIGGIMQKIGFWFINDIIWYKTNPTPNFMGTRLNNSHETLIWATKSKNARYTFNYKTAKELNVDTVNDYEYSKGVRKQMGSVWRFPVCSGDERLKDSFGKKLHSTQKPEALLYRIIAINSKKGDTVLDPFGGTMTTAAAAKKLGRNYIMIEQERLYCQYGEERLDAIEYIPSPIAEATYDKKPVRVSVQEMIKMGAFNVGEAFYLRDGVPIATLEKNGNLLYNGFELDMHTCAARARGVKASRVNGFDYWYVKRDDTLVSIARVRDLYRENLKA